MSFVLWNTDLVCRMQAGPVCVNLYVIACFIVCEFVGVCVHGYVGVSASALVYIINYVILHR